MKTHVNLKEENVNLTLNVQIITMLVENVLLKSAMSNAVFQQDQVALNMNLILYNLFLIFLNYSNKGRSCPTIISRSAWGARAPTSTSSMGDGVRTY